MRVIVTGGSGRLGQFVLRELVSRGHQVLSIDTVQPRECICPTAKVDLTNVQAVLGSFKDVDGVVHLARKRFPYTERGFDAASQSWEMPDIAGDAERFNHNVAITYNVLTAARHSSVQKVVCGSSLAVYGFYYPLRATAPDYLPIDEHHPRRPQDPYGLSKLLAEDICDAVARASDMQIATLRFSGIYTAADGRKLAERAKNPTIRGTGALWSYIDARDAARACRLALEADFRGHEAFNICAPTTIINIPTRELAERYVPQAGALRGDRQGNWSGYDGNKAAGTLGFNARHLFRNGTLE